MKTMFQKKKATIILLALILVFVTSTALGAAMGGQVIDLLIPKCDNVMEFIDENFPNTYSTSDDSMLGKAGTVFIDIENGEVRMIGDDTYRKYTFFENDGTPFACCVGIVVYAIDTSSALDYGVNVYLTEKGDTRLLEEKEISTLAAQFISMLN